MKSIKFILLAFVFCFTAHAQVYSVDLVPDSCGSVMATATKSFYLDLNNDAVNDFRFSLWSSSNSGGDGGVYMVALGSNSVATDSQGALNLNGGTVVNTLTSWSTSTVIIEYVTMIGFHGNWQFIHDNYIGIKFYGGTNLYCGWLHIDESVGSSYSYLCVKEFAYTLCSNNCVTSIAEQSLSQGIKVYPNPSIGVFTVELQGNEPVSVEVYNSVGEKLWAGKERNQCSVNLSNYANGVYLLKVGNRTQRLIKN